MLVVGHMGCSIRVKHCAFMSEYYVPNLAFLFQACDVKLNLDQRKVAPLSVITGKWSLLCSVLAGVSLFLWVMWLMVRTLGPMTDQVQDWKRLSARSTLKCEQAFLEGHALWTWSHTSTGRNKQHLCSSARRRQLATPSILPLSATGHYTTILFTDFICKLLCNNL